MNTMTNIKEYKQSDGTEMVSFEDSGYTHVMTKSVYESEIQSDNSHHIELSELIFIPLLKNKEGVRDLYIIGGRGK